jgi:hypothetical protein
MREVQHVAASTIRWPVQPSVLAVADNNAKAARILNEVTMFLLLLS